MIMNLSGPQPDNPTHEEIALIAPMRSIQGTPLFEETRLLASSVGIRKIPARAIDERLPLGEEVRDKPD